MSIVHNRVEQPAPNAPSSVVLELYEVHHYFNLYKIHTNVYIDRDRDRDR